MTLCGTDFVVGFYARKSAAMTMEEDLRAVRGSAATAIPQQTGANRAPLASFPTRLRGGFESCIVLRYPNNRVAHLPPSTSCIIETNHVNTTRATARYQKRKIPKRDPPRGTLLESMIIIPTGASFEKEERTRRCLLLFTCSPHSTILVS